MSQKTIKDLFSGKNMEKMPDIAFHLMTAMMKVMDAVLKHSAKNFETLGLKSGQTVIDYGCGPARYIQQASRAVGESGRIIAVDIHPLAIKSVKEKIKKYNLTNVDTVLADQYPIPLDNGTADVIYALDMFHMVAQPTVFLLELKRLLKKDGMIILEDGHQPRVETIQKIKNSQTLSIVQETKSHVKCKRSEDCV